jgi:AraC-like DNA-binding protein
MESVTISSQRLQPPVTSSTCPIITFEDARALYFGPALQLKPHRNAAFTLAVGLDAPIRLTLYAGRSGPTTSIESLIVHVPAGHHHRLDAEGMVAVIYLDALGDDVGQVGTLDTLAAHGAIAAEKRDSLRLWSLDRWRTVLGVAVAETADPRAAAIARAMVRDPNLYLSLAEAAHAAALSPTRFHAVFRKQLGAPFRRYRLWRRMGLAMSILATGSNITEAAHQAGFSSSAHFSHQFLRMFGLPPSSLIALNPDIRCEQGSSA